MKFTANLGRVAATCVAAGTALTLVATGSASAQSLTKVRIAYNPNPTNTALIVAQQQGFFKKNGIQPVFTSTQSTASLIPALGKQFDIVNATPPSVLQAAASGENLTLLAGDDVESPALKDTYFIAAKNITSIKQLKGAKIGVPTLSGSLYESAVIALNKAGIKKSQVKFLQVPFPDMAGDLANGTLEAVNTIVPFQGELLGEGYKSLGDPMLAVTQSKPGLDIGWGASVSWAKAHPSVVKGFIKAQEQAVTWIKSHKAATEQILEKDFQLPAQAADNYPLYQYFSFGLNKKYLSDWVTPMKAVGDLPAKYSPNYKSLLY